jgi:hypothetical protein
MNVRRILSRLRKILHSLATRVPKVVLHRAKAIFPALNTSLEPNGSIKTTAQDTPDDGPMKARNMQGERRYMK